jgi:hypothetical protein
MRMAKTAKCSPAKSAILVLHYRLNVIEKIVALATVEIMPASLMQRALYGFCFPTARFNRTGVHSVHSVG